MFAYGALVIAYCASHFSVSAATPVGGNASDAQTILAKAVDAMGGRDALSRVSGLTMMAPDQSLTQTYSIHVSDVFVAAKGNQNVSFNYLSNGIQQSVDRQYTFAPYWVWALPTLDPPMSFSLIVEAGNDSRAFFRNGSNSLLTGPGNLGFADSGLTQYLVDEAQRSDPLLAFRLSQMNTTKTTKLSVNGLDIPAVLDPTSGTTLALHPDTYLPWFVRRQDYNRIFGQSENDVLFTDYKQVNFSGSSVMLPYRKQMVYNDQVVEDTVFANITINPSFPSDQFTIQPSQEDMFQAPHTIDSPANWTVSDIGPFYETALWGGNFARTLDNVTATHPVPSLPQLWRLDFADSEGSPAGYAQLVVEIEDGVFIADSPNFLSTIVLDWVATNIKKPIKYLWPSHHHHDHAYGSADFVAAGAKMVVPAIAEQYWSQIPNVTFITFDETQPFVLSDDEVQIRALWRPGAPHAEDWGWLLVTELCPQEEDSVVVFEADVWDPESTNTHTNFDLARQWLAWLAEDGISNNTVVVASHGDNYALQDLIDITGYPYPKHGIKDFKAGGDLCRSS